MNTARTKYNPILSLFWMALARKRIIIQVILSVAFILFWLYVIYVKVSDFAEFKREMNGQVFQVSITTILPYALPVTWLVIAALLAFAKTRLLGMLLNLSLLLCLTIYVGLAVFKVYSNTPCACSGLFHFNWNEQFYFNLLVTAVAGTGFILTIKDQERRNKV